MGQMNASQMTEQFVASNQTQISQPAVSSAVTNTYVTNTNTYGSTVTNANMSTNVANANTYGSNANMYGTNVTYGTNIAPSFQPSAQNVAPMTSANAPITYGAPPPPASALYNSMATPCAEP